MEKKNKEKINIKSKLKQALLIILFIALLIFVQRIIYHKLAEESATTENNTQKTVENVADENNIENPDVKDEPENKEELEIVATMHDDIHDNAVWCGTMQLAWNEMLKKYGDNIATEKVRKLSL